MTRLKAFDPNLVPKMSDRFVWTSNSRRDDAELVMRTFRDMAIGLPKPCAGATQEELVAAGIVGLYET